MWNSQRALSLYEDVMDWAVHAVPVALGVLVLGWIMMRVSLNLIRRLKKIVVAHLQEQEEGGNDLDASELEKRVETLFGMAQTIVRATIFVVVLMLSLRHLGLDIAPLLAGAGIVGLAVGFGAQELVRDTIAGFFLLLENHVRTGDVAVINGTGGLVERIGLRTVILRDLAGTVHVFQNGKIQSLANMTKGWSAMVFDIGVSYGTDVDQAMGVMREVAAELQADEKFASLILSPMEVFGVDSFGDSEVVIKARLRTEPIEQWNVGREYRRRLKRAFSDAGIEIPFPQRTVWLEQSPAPVPRGAP